MTGHILLYYPYASFTNTQLPLLKVAALWFGKLIILDSVGGDTIGSGRTSKAVAHRTVEGIWFFL